MLLYSFSFLQMSFYVSTRKIERHMRLPLLLVQQKYVNSIWFFVISFEITRGSWCYWFDPQDPTDIFV